jgi:hypothetical protein
VVLFGWCVKSGGVEFMLTLLSLATRFAHTAMSPEMPVGTR